MKNSWLFIFMSIFFSFLSQSAKTSQIKAVNKSKHKDLLILINQGAPQVKNTFVTDTLRAQFVKKAVAKEAAKDPAEKPAEKPAEEAAKEPAKDPAEKPAEKPAEEAAKEPAKEAEQEPIVMRNFVKKENLPEAVYEIKSTQIKPSNLWNATVFQGKQVFKANLQEHPTLRALDDKVDITIEISDDGQLKFIPSCPCPAAVDVVAKEDPKK